MARSPVAYKARGALSNPASRYLDTTVVDFDPAAQWDPDLQPRLATTCMPEQCRSIITRNRSPDVPFDLSINPYRGCEHGCIYCYARPSHAFLDLSPGLDFETRLFFKPDAAERLKEELARPGYRCQPIALGTNTDPYQPVEQRLQVTRAILEVLVACRHPFTIVTKSTLIERDLDLIAAAAARKQAAVMISVTTLDERLKRSLEPRAAAPRARLRSIAALREAGIPVGVLFAPVIPAVNDAEMETILEAVQEAGADSAAYMLLRLPYELGALFQEWLETHLPERAGHVMSLVRQMRGGRSNDPRFGHRMRGSGEFARLLESRFRLATRRLGLAPRESRALDCAAFVPPRAASAQLGLF